MFKALRRIFKVLRWVGLFIFSVLFFVILAIPSLIIFLITTFDKRNIGEALDIMDIEYRKVLYTIDLLACVTVFNWLDWRVKKNPYGIIGQTVSYVLYLRKRDIELTKIDAIIYKLILNIDPNHFKVFDK